MSLAGGGSDGSLWDHIKRYSNFYDLERTSTTLAALFAIATGVETKLKDLVTSTIKPAKRNNRRNLPHCHKLSGTTFSPRLPRATKLATRELISTISKSYQVKKIKKLSYWKGKCSNFQLRLLLHGVTRTTTFYRRNDKNHS